MIRAGSRVSRPRDGICPLQCPDDGRDACRGRRRGGARRLGRYGCSRAARRDCRTDTKRAFVARPAGAARRRLRHLGGILPAALLAPAGVPGAAGSAGCRRSSRCSLVSAIDDVREVRVRPFGLPSTLALPRGARGWLWRGAEASVALTPVGPCRDPGRDAGRSRGRRTSTTSWTAATGSPRRWR